MLSKLLFSVVGLAAVSQAYDFSNYALVDVKCDVYNNGYATTKTMDNQFYKEHMYTVMFNVYGGYDTYDQKWIEDDDQVMMVMFPDYSYPDDGDMVITSLTLSFGDDYMSCRGDYEPLCSWKADYGWSRPGKLDNNGGYNYWGWDMITLCAAKEEIHGSIEAVTGFAANDFTVNKFFRSGFQDNRFNFEFGEGSESVQSKTYSMFATVETAPWNDGSSAWVSTGIPDFCFQRPLGTDEAFDGCFDSTADQFSLYTATETIETGVNPFADKVAEGKKDLSTSYCYDALFTGACLHNPDWWIQICPQKCSL